MYNAFIIAILLLFTVNNAECYSQSTDIIQYQANLETCLRGYSPYLCKHNILTKEDAKQVKHAEYQANLTSKKSVQYTGNAEYNKIKTFGKCAENNSCYGDISTITGRPKTTYVKGYYRRNGTYVRSHYRSR